ncbi:DUF262 domain-containing HNH endonuclease family protein [Plectonema radiosum NIES-515]|uniref:DUF262 domain-containing HNH endonuclease family protein n=1 Tax=Plectonema radiosum NIES-515 TaxID=2986073 RepID=A0ABT3AUB7_9CYAN|nr:DUF262 domain-containing HNH endonuclease family protein [Plectonema radiosum]MCV3212707.1 DUF262 domain-containing HNH endonuclease family protein [Plectonema radiosum NIES-515]
MPTSSIDSRLMSFGELLTGNNSYSVPSFQRDYSWTEAQIDQLWNDITETLDEGRSEHFIGAVVVNNSKKPELMLIDGQQRVTTMSILMCVLRNIAKEKGDDQLAQTISNKYLGSLNLRTRKTESKLVLNERNNQFYQEYIVESQTITFLRELSVSKKRSIDKSNKLIVDAYLFLYQKIQERIKELGKKVGDIVVLIELEECIRDKLVSILISVADEANSYLIFETLNDRGLDLSVADLLKNYLFSRASDRLKEVQRKWEQIISDKLDLTRFIRHYWLSKYGLVTEKDLYRKIAIELRNSSQIFDFVSQLREAAEIYAAFENSQSPVWDSYNSDLKKDIERLNLFKVSQCYSVLLAAKESLTDELFPKALRIIVILSFRYNVICASNPNKLESAYSNAARYIREHKPKSAKHIFEQLKEFYPSDTEFERAFVEKSFTASNTKLARYILSEINSHYMDSKELIANPNATELNLEHILPQKPSDKWLVEFSKTDPNQYIYRLGNMTLLDSSVNRKVGNTSFEEKSAKAFSNSKLDITREILKDSVWGPKQIEERQKKMAKMACQIWRLNY